MPQVFFQTARAEARIKFCPSIHDIPGAAPQQFDEPQSMISRFPVDPIFEQDVLDVRAYDMKMTDTANHSAKIIHIMEVCCRGCIVVIVIDCDCAFFFQAGLLADDAHVKTAMEQVCKLSRKVDELVYLRSKSEEEVPITEVRFDFFYLFCFFIFF